LRFTWRSGLPLLLAAYAIPLLLVAWIAPAYLRHRGFPLDDAWIHMVYGRSLAREGMLAYNPGTPAVGETSPLWAAFLTLPHLLGLAPAGAVLWVKLAGWALHVAAAFLVGRALGHLSRGLAWLAFLVILLHPELAAAAMSGMEVPLAEAMIALQIGSLVQGRPGWFGLAALLAPGCRPEVGILAPMLGLGCAPGGHPENRVRWAGIGLAGAALGYGLLFSRCHLISGSWLPSTYHAKVVPGIYAKSYWMYRGVYDLLPSLLPLPKVCLLLFIFLLMGLAGFRLARGGEVRPVLMGLAGFVLLMVCSALSHPLEVQDFYFRRYLLVGLVPVLVAAAFLGEVATRPLPSWMRWIFGGGWVLALVLLWPARFRHLDNDAHNIDDVQVELGRSLARLPAEAGIWVVDAGAVRYFAKGFVVDLMGLNTPEMLGPNASAFLAAHPAQVVEVVPGWNGLDLTGVDRGVVTAREFKPSTPYTITSFQPMAGHSLVTASKPVHGQVKIRGKVFPLWLSPLPGN
jgi:hypothetical protein